MNDRITIIPAFDPLERESCIEQKFVFNAAKKDVLLDWLEFHFERDSSFYFGPIVTLYYDTPSLSLYGQVRNGDYLKTKVRLRWYQKHFPPEQRSVSCYMEIKQKCGTRRYKQRQPQTLEPGCLTGDIFSQPAILEAPYELAELHVFARNVLVPILLVEYERFRFIDPVSGSRISLDSRITCSRANSAYLADAPLAWATDVLEIKGDLDELPDH